MLETIIITLLTLNILLTAWLAVGTRQQSAPKRGDVITLDSSAIIDGRILEIAKVGFLPKNIVVPQFILDELHNIADSSDSLKRERGRFGLELVNDLDGLAGMNVEIVKTPPSDEPVDDQLVDYTKELGGRVVTNDYALIQIARIKGVPVLNVNELSQAIRAIALPGEQVEIKIVQKGSDPGQGVGYLDDGTMVVVDKADRLVGKRVKAKVSRILQTSAGKMLFADRVPTGNNQRKRHHSKGKPDQHKGKSDNKQNK